MEQQRIVILHGFSQDETLAVMRAVRAALPPAVDAAFAMTTATNREWKVGELMEHVAEEHRQFKELRDRQKKASN